MKIIHGLALYGPESAGARYRLMQYIDGLHKQKIVLKIDHLLKKDFLDWRFHNKKFPFLKILKSYLYRAISLFFNNQYGLIIIHCELFPYMPFFIENILLKNKKYIYDMDDAFFLRYDNAPFLIRKILKNKFVKIIKNANAVTAGNSYLYSYAKNINENVYFIPTVLNHNIFLPNKKIKYLSNKITIGWIGSHSTFPYLFEIINSLSIVGRSYDIDFVIIGGYELNISNVNVINYEWEQKTEIDLINTFDIGVMPIPKNEWSKGKCGFKLLQYMSCEIPVIATNFGANVDIVDSKVGFLVDTESDWINAFTLLIQNESLRNEMGKNGRDRISSKFNLNSNINTLTNVIFKHL